MDEECSAVEVPFEFADEFASSNHSQRARCILGVVKEVCEKEGGELKKLWDEADKAIKSKIEELKKCRDVPDQDDRVKCFREKGKELRLIIRKLFKDIRGVNEEAIKEIRKLVKEKCKRPSAFEEDDAETFELDETAPTGSLGAKLRCIIDGISNVTQHHDKTIADLWNKTHVQLKAQVEKLKTCRQDSSSTAECVRLVVQTSRKLLRDFYQATRQVSSPHPP